MSPTRYRVYVQLLCTGNQLTFLLHMWHPWCYLCYLDLVCQCRHVIELFLFSRILGSLSLVIGDLI
jgi:hypothetical protein